jgi:hypothetical protein
MERLYVARRSFDYDSDLHLDRGQVFQLKNCLNDEKLIRIGYIKEMRGGRPVQCGVCGAQFAGDAELNSHGNFRHETKTEEEQDRSFESRIDLENKIAPLYLDQTAATKDPAAARRGGTRRQPDLR